MREIKFRAYDKELNKMIGWDFIKKVRNLQKLLSLNHVVVMQYTGLKDKNGVKICDGDIVRAEYFGEESREYIHQQIYYKKEYCMFVIGSCEEDEENLTDEISSNIEIVGNIYENGNLL